MIIFFKYYKIGLYISESRLNRNVIHICPICDESTTKMKRHLERKHAKLSAQEMYDIRQQVYSKKRKSIAVTLPKDPSASATPALASVALAVPSIPACVPVSVQIDISDHEYTLATANVDPLFAVYSPKTTNFIKVSIDTCI